MRKKTNRALPWATPAAGMAAGLALAAFATLTASATAQVAGLKSQDVGFPALAGSTTFAAGKYT
ncbi:MAG: hypothetical protein ACYDC1_08345, partial [Limisphaerales bacterium]